MENYKKKVAIWFESLLGRGHIPIVDSIAWGLKNVGFDVHILTTSAWRAPSVNFAGANLIEYSDNGRLRSQFIDGIGHCTQDGIPIINASEWQQERTERLLEAYKKIKPDVLIVDLYPFGRGQLQDVHEMVRYASSLINRPLICAETRDVILSSDPPVGGSDMEVAKMIAKNFDHVFLTGDGQIKITDYMPEAKYFINKVSYAGYISDAEPIENLNIKKENETVLFSAGGSATEKGLLLLKDFILAKGLLPEDSPVKDSRWVAMASARYKENPELNTKLQEIKELAIGAGVELKENIPRKDFLKIQQNAVLNVGMVGLNQILEYTMSGVPYVAAPMSMHARNQEQLFRANKFSEMGGKVSIFGIEDWGNPLILAEKMTEALSKKHLPDLKIGIGGENNIATTLLDLLKRKSTEIKI